MARNGSGTYSLPEAPFVSGTVISSTAVNSDLSDIGNALTGSIAANGETPITANLPMSGYRHTGVGNSSARTMYAATGQVQDSAFTWCGTAGGTADALTLTPTPAIAAYATGQRFMFKASSSANTGAATVAVSGLTAKDIQLNDAALTAGAIAANKYYEIVYDGTQFQVTRVSGSLSQAASETVAGIIEIATAAETTTGTDDTRAITPLKLTTFAPASATLDTANDKLIILDATDSKLKQVSYPSTTSITYGTPVATTSGTTKDFTSLPSGIKRIYVMLKGVSKNNTSRLTVQLGESGGGFKTSGYVGSSWTGGTFNAMSSGFDINDAVSGAIVHGLMILQKYDGSNNIWECNSAMARTDSPFVLSSAGSVSLAGTLDRLRLTSTGADTFTAGEFNIAYE